MLVKQADDIRTRGGKGLVWLALALDRGVTEVLPFGLYPFVPGDVLKLLLAAGMVGGL